eukprot:2131285-Amphidinium_carterae.1
MVACGKTLAEAAFFAARSFEKSTSSGLDSFFVVGLTTKHAPHEAVAAEPPPPPPHRMLLRMK